jgi:hypothetical protein
VHITFPTQSDPAVMRQINDLMRDGLRKRDPGEAIAFFCECADPDCYQPVWLTGEEYDRLRPDPRVTFLAEAHRWDGRRPSAPPPTPRAA